MQNSLVPRSASTGFSSVGGAAAFVAALYTCRYYGYNGVPATLLAIFSYASASFLIDVLVLRTPCDPRNELNFSQFHFSAERSFYKILGAFASVLFVLFWYWLFPEYHFNVFRDDNDAGFYRSFGDAAILLMWPIIILGAFYITLVDAVMITPEDRLYWLGRWLLRKPTQITRSALIQQFYTLICRGYFLPLLFVYCQQEFEVLLALKPVEVDSSSYDVFYAIFHFTTALGLVVAISGFAFALRLMGTHIRSVDPHLFGWWVCLFFFEPFRSYTIDYFKTPDVNDPWLHALSGFTEVQQIWCWLLVLFLMGKLIADLTLGSRYGQLMHRGIVTNGLYRYMKHPSYLFEVLYFWFAFMPPLIFNDVRDMAHATFGLLGMTLIYYLRARTEERHLSRDPVYVAYALWIEKNGLLRVLGECFPLMRFKLPVEDRPEITSPVYRGLAYP